MSTGRYIALAGAEGCGKCTQAARLAPALAAGRGGRPHNTDATALSACGGHPIPIVVADDTTFVDHTDNDV